jgi:ribose transport system substrate-binding protein
VKKIISSGLCVALFLTFTCAVAMSAEREWARSALWDPNKAKMVDTSRFKKKGPWTIAYSNCAVSNSFGIFTALQIRAEAEKYPNLIKKVLITDAQDKPDKQIADMEDLVTKGADLIIIRAATEAALDPIVTRFHKEGIPVICMGRRVKSDNFVSFSTSSNYTEGRMQAVWLAQMLKGKGNVVMLSGMAGAGSSEERKRGAYEAFAHYPEIKVLDQQYTKYSASEGKRIMQAMIQSFGKQIDGVWCDCGLQAQGAIEALHEAGMKVPLTGDHVNGFMTRVVKYKYEAMGISFPASMAASAVKLGIKILKGEPVPFIFEEPRVVSTTVDTADVRSDGPWEDYALFDKSDDWWVANTLPEKWWPK